MLESYSPKSTQKQITYLVIAVIGLALYLRIWGIGFGLPYDFTPDEPHHILRAFKLGAGEHGPILRYWASVGKGGLCYMLFVEYGLLYIVWWIMGRVGDLRDFALLYLQDPSVFYLIGRLTVALMGTLTCLVIFLVGKSLYGPLVGLGAAFIGSMAYTHGVYSHLINVHIAMTLALWASILSYIQYERKKDLRWLIGAGSLGGIATVFANTGAIVLLVLLMAIGLPSERREFSRQVLKEAGILLMTMLVTLTVLAPEWIMNLGYYYQNFSQILGKGADVIGSYEGNVRDSIDSVTILRRQEWTGYFKILFKKHNFALTFSVLLGVGLGLWQRDRWTIIWTVLITFLLFIFSAADRSATPRYLLPMMPCFWLLSSRAVVIVSGHRWWLTATGLVGVVILSLMALVRYDYVLTKPDTRVLAKEWLEENVPSGAKILMDGMQNRFVQSPPLNPNRSTVARLVAQVRTSTELDIPQRALALYAEAMKQVEGPTYELYSTVYGLGVENLTYYVQNCFDYIITSSNNSKRYAHENNRKRYPKSARFYDQLKGDPRFRVVYYMAPTPWKRQGPVITVYKVVPTCQAPQGNAEMSSK